MHNVSKAVALWLMSGYAAPLTTEHFHDSRELANSTVAGFAADPDHIKLNNWLDEITNCVAAVSFMHNYWYLTHNCGEARDLISKPNVPKEFCAGLMQYVDSISTMP